MNKLLTFIAIPVVFLFSPRCFASGVLIDIKGDVKVGVPGAKESQGKVGAELSEGSTVIVNNGGAAVVMLSNGAIDQISSGSRYVVGKEAVQAKRINFGSSLALAMREATTSGEGPTVHGMVKEAKGPKGLVKLPGLATVGINAIYPSGTSIRTANTIIFKWEAEPKIDWPKPALVIDDASKKHISISAVSVGSNELKVEISKAGIKKGQSYSWFLAQQEGGINGKTRRFEFKILSDADEKNLDSDITKIRSLKMGPEGKDILVAQLYLGFMLNEEAVQAILPVWQKTKSPYVAKLLHLGFSRMGQQKEAESYSAGAR